MPDTGEQVERGQVYETADGGLYLCRQDHPRGINDPDAVPALFARYRTGDDLEWQPNGEMLKVGDIRTLDGDEYIVQQPHQALAGRSPKDYTAGWLKMKPIPAPGEGPPEWEVGIRWEAGDKCTYQGKVYATTMTHTSDAPNWNPVDSPNLWDPV
ncbi:MAG: hypothetical protein U5L04_01625 [Trueperaceae bacterium]|nr:hypothetical protein [Trueperaceae bacterium]